MLRFFKRRRPQHRVTGLVPSEAIVASAWGLSECDWLGLTDFERAECRRNVTAAPRFQP